MTFLMSNTETLTYMNAIKYSKPIYKAKAAIEMTSLTFNYIFKRQCD